LLLPAAVEGGFFVAVLVLEVPVVVALSEAFVLGVQQVVLELGELLGGGGFVVAYPVIVKVGAQSGV